MFLSEVQDNDPKSPFHFHVKGIVIDPLYVSTFETVKSQNLHGSWG